VEPEPRREEPAPQVRDESEDEASLIRWTLSLTVQERLELLQRNVAALKRLSSHVAGER
jgi:hypothetical protein